MAKKTDQRIEIFRTSHLPRLIESYNPSLVLLFGSCVRGTALKESDLDLLIVSKSFEGIPFVERAQRVIWAMRSSLPVEVLCYTPDE
jgi:predicted nucleotidyltransferase